MQGLVPLFSSGVERRPLSEVAQPPYDGGVFGERVRDTPSVGVRWGTARGRGALPTVASCACCWRLTHRTTYKSLI